MEVIMSFFYYDTNGVRARARAVVNTGGNNFLEYSYNELGRVVEIKNPASKAKRAIKNPADEMIINFLNDADILSCFGSRGWIWDDVNETITYRGRLIETTDEKESEMAITFSDANVKAGFTPDFQKRFLEKFAP